MSTVKANTIEPASGGTVTITGAALTTPALGTPASGTLTNCTGLPGSGVVNTPSGGISATTAQGAINELDSEKASLSGASFTGKVSATHATADDNAVSFSNTSATGYGPFFRGGSSTRYAAIFTDKDGTQLSLLTGAGELIVGTNTSPLSTSKMSVLATSSTNGVAVRAGLDANYLYIGQNSSGTDTFRVVGNGNVTNTNNSYGAISDAKLKRDVTTTGPKLSKVLAMRIVNYFLIADPTNTKLLGMIAQQLREISPGLVQETPDFEDVVVEPARTDHIPRQRQKTEARTVTQWKVEVRDGVAVRTAVHVTEQVPLFVDLPLVGEDGQPIMDVVDGKPVPAVFRQPVMEDYTEAVDVPARIERRATGTVTLSIKYSILVPMLIKAMQELHADFDQRLIALEA